MERIFSQEGAGQINVIADRRAWAALQELEVLSDQLVQGIYIFLAAAVCGVQALGERRASAVRSPGSWLRGADRRAAGYCLLAQLISRIQPEKDDHGS